MNILFYVISGFLFAACAIWMKEMTSRAVSFGEHGIPVSLMFIASGVFAIAGALA